MTLLSKSEKIVEDVLKLGTWGAYSTTITESMEVLHHPDANTLVCSFLVREKHLNGMQTLHGGAIATLIDMATSFALWKIDNVNLSKKNSDFAFSF